MSSEAITKNDLTNIINAIFPATTEDMSQAQIDAFIASLNVIGINAVDYVVEEGTSGIWTYQKWNSGKAECWGQKVGSYSVNTSSTAYGGFRSSEISHSFPFTFMDVPFVVATLGSGSNGSWVNNVQGTTTTEVKLFLSSGATQSATDRTIHIHAIGTWK